jgi:hypothetical protein
MDQIIEQYQKDLEAVQAQIAQLEAALQAAHDVAMQLLGGIKAMQHWKEQCTTKKEQSSESA